MDSLLSVSPGLMIWTLINFFIFLFLILKFGGKSIVKGLENRENHINDQLESAEKANKTAIELLAQSEAKLKNAAEEMQALIAKGHEQAKMNLQRATEEAEEIRHKKVDDAVKQIELQKKKAIDEIKDEVTDMVISATEKIISSKLNESTDTELIKSYLGKINKN
jgi:F-type H+-transporting ATPase subunit b